MSGRKRKPQRRGPARAPHRPSRLRFNEAALQRACEHMMAEHDRFAAAGADARWAYMAMASLADDDGTGSATPGQIAKRVDELKVMLHDAAHTVGRPDVAQFYGLCDGQDDQ